MVRFANFSPNAPALDVYVNGESVVRELKFGAFSSFFSVPTGLGTVSIYVSGTHRDPILVKGLHFFEGGRAVVLIINKLSDIAIFKINLPKNLKDNETLLRVVQVAPNLPAMNVRVSYDKAVFEDVQYRAVTEYKKVPEGAGTVGVYLSMSGTAVLAASVEVMPRKANSLYIYGLLESSPELSVKVVEDD